MPRLSKNSDTTKAINYSLNRWDAFTRFLEDGRLCMSNNAAERELRAVALGRKNWTFAGSDEGGRRAAAIYTLIATAKLRTQNMVDASVQSVPGGKGHDRVRWFTPARVFAMSRKEATPTQVKIALHTELIHRTTETQWAAKSSFPASRAAPLAISAPELSSPISIMSPSCATFSVFSNAASGQALIAWRSNLSLRSKG